MKIVIEKNVPLTSWAGNAKKIRKYPFAKMVVGDSFSVTPKNKVNFQSSVHALSKAERAQGRKFATRSYQDGSVRVWRIA